MSQKQIAKSKRKEELETETIFQIHVFLPYTDLPQ